MVKKVEYCFGRMKYWVVYLHPLKGRVTIINTSCLVARFKLFEILKLTAYRVDHL